MGSRHRMDNQVPLPDPTNPDQPAEVTHQEDSANANLDQVMFILHRKKQTTKMSKSKVRFST